MDTHDLKVNGVIKRLVEARQNAGLLQKQVARMMGYNTSVISKLEGGFTPIPLKRLFQLADIYEVDIVWLMTGSNPAFDRKAWKDLTDSLDQTNDALMQDMERVGKLLESLQQNSLSDSV